MTTFVSLAPDSAGTASAVAVGEWLLMIIKHYDTHDGLVVKEYHRKFLAHFSSESDTGEATAPQPLLLLQLLLSQQELVFRWLNEAKTTGIYNANKEKRPFNECLKEAEDFFNLCMSMVALRIPDVENAGQAAGEFVLAYRNGDDLPDFRLKLLMALYNIFPSDFPYRFPIYVAIMEYAAEHNLFHMLTQYSPYIVDWMKDWNLAAAPKRQVFWTFAKELKKLGKLEEAYKFLKLHVEYLQGEPEDVLTDPVAVQASMDLIIDSLKLSDILYFDSILALDAVNVLKTLKPSNSLDSPSAYSNVVYDLGIVFCRGVPTELEEIRQKHPMVFEVFGLNYDSLLNKLQLLTVSSLMGKKKHSTLKALSDLLRTSETETEALVVQAIGQGIVDAKLDQISRTLHVKTTFQREFGQPQWEDVLSRLEHWTEGVKTLLACQQNVDQQQKQQQRESAAGLAQKQQQQLLQS